MVYRIAWFIARPLLVLLYRTQWVGRANVPREGGVILAGNHVSYLDPVIIAAGLWRKVSFMAKSELFEMPALAWLVRGLTAFPVRRSSADREAIAKASSILAAGGAVGIFPEGTRIREGAGEAQEGAAFIALRTGAVIVPVGISGTGRIRPKGVRTIRFPALTAVYGEPVDPASFEGGRRERIAAITAEVMRRIEAARDEAGRMR